MAATEWHGSGLTLPGTDQVKNSEPPDTVGSGTTDRQLVPSALQPSIYARPKQPLRGLYFAAGCPLFRSVGPPDTTWEISILTLRSTDTGIADGRLKPALHVFTVQKGEGS
jgi:hypothetical protein